MEERGKELWESSFDRNISISIMSPLVSMFLKALCSVHHNVIDVQDRGPTHSLIHVSLINQDLASRRNTRITISK